MIALIQKLLRWPWLYLAGAAALVMPWLCYAVAGFIAAAAELNFPQANRHWISPSSDVIPFSAIISFIACILFGLGADRLRRKA